MPWKSPPTAEPTTLSATTAARPAMEMSLRALDIGPGDEVITTPYTYSATAEVIRNVGAKIVFCDLKHDSFEMDYEKLSGLITERTKAVMPVDYGGVPCRYADLFQAISSKASLYHPSTPLQKSIGRVAVVADAAHSFGAGYEGYPIGCVADFTCFSFHVLKPITTGGEGGAAVWRDFDNIDNDLLERRMALLGDHGQTGKNIHKIHGRGVGVRHRPVRLQPHYDRCGRCGRPGAARPDGGTDRRPGEADESLLQASA